MRLDHMDAHSRNERLYRQLTGMGLCVFPIPAPDDSSRIDYLMVSAELPLAVREHGSEQAASTGIAEMMARPKVGEVVGASECDGNNVVDFPTVVGSQPVV